LNATDIDTVFLIIPLNNITDKQLRTALFWVITQRNFLPRSRDNLSVPSSWSLKMGPTGCPETSVRNYHYSLRNKPEERCSHLSHGEVCAHAQISVTSTACLHAITDSSPWRTRIKFVKLYKVQFTFSVCYDSVAPHSVLWD